ncbi:unnamed protein product [Tuber aestivum]|uniref:B30.2/SPRY domain-containing protein n=1 Tax=Tuber aestivum TaxID=59557 RepID=A0A292PKJ4_9PEZI|nr:unnamed protein product [Tuber aestivum]
MEALALSSNIIAVLSLAGKLLAAGYRYGSGSAQFPPEIRHLVQEVTALSGVLHAVKILVGDPAINTGIPSGGSGDLIRTMGETVEQCRKLIEGMLRDLQKYDVANKRRGAWRHCWPLKEKTREWCERLERHKSLFEVALSVDEVSSAREIRNDIEDIKAIQSLKKQDEKQAVYDSMLNGIRYWLSPADPQSNHLAARKLCQYGTGRWFTERKEFQDWLKAGKSFLWLHGIPGAGKTILSSTVIEHISTEFTKEPGSILAYFYCDFKQTSKQKATNLIGSIIWQVANQKPTMPRDVENFFLAKSGDGPPSLSGLIDLLRHLSARIPKLAIVVDAVDECGDSLQPTMLETLRELAGISNVNLLVVSRDHLNIKLHFEGLPRLGIQKKDVAKDIELFISQSIERKGKLKRLSSHTKQEVIDALVKGAQGMFRWAKCCLDQIGKLRTDKAIKSALESLPPTLDETYERILCGIAEGDRELALQVFRFLLCGDRDLTLSEIREGLAIEVGSKRMDPDNRLNDEEDILDICGGLVDRNEKNIAELTHFSVKEYLISPNLAKGKASYYYIDETLGNAEISKIIYTYLLLEDFSAGPCSTVAEFDLRGREYPLFLYASKSNWKHVLKYEYGSDMALDALLVRFYSNDNNPNFNSWRQALSSKDGNVTRYLDPACPTATLVYASLAGLWQLVKGIIGRGAGVDFSGGGTVTPLQVAAEFGHSKTVKVLLKYGANTETSGDGAMRIAAVNGHAGCIKALIEAGATCEKPDVGRYGDSISLAVVNGHEDVLIEILCAEYYTKTEEVKSLWEAMYLAVEVGFDRAVQILIEKYGSRIICDSNENFPKTLKLIAEHGRVKALQCLLQKPEAMEILLRDNVFAPMLEGAVYYGQVKIVELLLRNRKGSPSLGVSFHLAIAKGFLKISEMLLCEGADPRAKDEHGWTPMFYAMQRLKEGSVEKLLTVLGDDDESEIMNITGMGPGSWEAIGNSTGLKISEDGCRVENISTSKEQLRTKFPITPVVDDYYFEVHILKASKDCTIGFVDAMYYYVIDGFYLYSYPLGDALRSWGYVPGFIRAEESNLIGSIPHFTTNDIIGCHFDRIRGAVSFTMNGKRADLGEVLPGIRGKLRPMIRLEPGDEIRANFGGEPFVYEIPEPAAPEAYIRKPSPGWPIGDWYQHDNDTAE